MSRSTTGLFAALALLALAPAARASSKEAAPSKESPSATEAKVGAPAPDFELKDLDGKSVKLSELRGKTVVLEWFNPECPFVKFAHTKGPLKDQGNLLAEKGVLWLAVNSGAPGKQGHGLETNRTYAKEFGMKYPVLLDESGSVGKQFGAKHTPHMFVIDPEGKLVFKGGIDNSPFGETVGDKNVNYVEAALADLANGRPIAEPEPKPYGCSVKY